MGPCEHIFSFFLGTHQTFLICLVAMMYPPRWSYKAHLQTGPRDVSTLLVQLWKCVSGEGQVHGQV